MHTPKSPTLLKVNLMSNSRIKVHTKAKECMHECVGVRAAELPWQRNLYLYKPRLQCGGMEGWRPFKLPDCPSETTRGPQRGLSATPKASGVQGCPVCTSLGHLFFVPRLVVLSSSLAVTMAIAGATLWLERVLKTGS